MVILRIREKNLQMCDPIQEVALLKIFKVNLINTDKFTLKHNIT